MLRNLALSTVAGLALMTPLAVAPAAQARVPEAPREAHHERWREHEHWHHRYEVMYRSCRDRPWVFYSGCEGRGEAYRIADDLRAQGYEVFVRD